MKFTTAALTITFALAQVGTALAAPETDAARVEQSFAKWKTLKEKCGGNYSYAVRWSSFAGFGHTTTIVVRDNEVSERRFERFSLRPPVPGEAAPKQEGWIEKGKEVGTHSEGAPARTLDEIYVIATKIATAEVPEFSRRYVRFDKQGLLTSCFTVDTRIADDAPMNGVSLSSITLEKTE